SQLQLLGMPYYGKDLSMVVLLPYTVNRLPELEAALNPQNLAAWLAMVDQSRAKEIAVSFPRFTTSQSLDLATVLKRLGMISAFDDNANLSGIDGTTNLFVS